MVVVPSSYTVRLLIRPSSDVQAPIYPLEIVVSGEDSTAESLLTLMQKGDMSSAKTLADAPVLAEQLLHQKFVNTDAAAVGGYFLLRIKDLNRLHNWANNLADWFDWMADGPIIHAWQILLSILDTGDLSSARELARKQLLEAVKRGIPVYTEGLRLLREGLLYFHRFAKGEDAEVAAALDSIGRYAVAADWAMTSTTFTGSRPDAPSEKSRRGTPKDKTNILYVFDVPLDQIVKHADLTPNTTLITTLLNGELTASKLTDRNELKLADGTVTKGFSAANQHLGIQSLSGGDYEWHALVDDMAVFDTGVMSEASEPEAAAGAPEDSSAVFDIPPISSDFVKSFNSASPPESIPVSEVITDLRTFRNR